ncbi:transcriptional repressor [Candidatus Gracilibacteria bacterium]|nr:transcriptional repressor [Candidatus Gracilibacteria bacterium]
MKKTTLRKSALRTAMMDIFSHAKAPLTVPSLQEALKKKKLSPNKTSLYRHLDTLVSLGALEELVLESSVTHYELQRHHHHHFVCESCEKIECLEDSQLEKSIHALEDTLKKKGLSAQKHQFSFSGTCKSCLS